ncbi:hypothetical protein BASA83_013601 [Batrachochytrium salamandrivorans]|nr:hypothetical protein BASA83_013601 [Batrachochytrium salamandrivorans]
MQTQKATTGKANPLPVVLSLTVSARMVRSFPVRKVAMPPQILLPLPPWPGLFACDRLTAIARSRATPKKARDASPPPQDDLWVVVKNLSQQFAAQQTELATLSNAFALQQKTIADLEKINRDLEKVLSNMASQMTSTTQTQVCGYQAKPTTTTTATTTTTTTDQPSKDTRFADAVKKRPTHQQLVERQPEFRKAGAAAWLALKRETSVPAHSAPKVELSSGLRIIYASGFPYAKPGDLRKAMQGARIRTSAVRDIRWISRQVVQLLVDADYVSAFTRIITSLDATIVKSFKAWVPRSEAADKDKLAAISSFAAKTVTTIQRSPDVKARNFFRSLLASIGGKDPRGSHCRGGQDSGSEHPVLTYQQWR